MLASALKKCFVVMPFGRKSLREVVEAPQPGGTLSTVDAKVRQVEIDFDQIYKHIIEPAVEGKDEKGETLGLDCMRSDDAKESGMVHREMIGHIIDADVVIVDITLENPNVFYELGVRHSLRRSTTVVIRHARHHSRFPFNIAGMRAVEYDHEKIPESIKRIREAIRASFSGKDVDSLVHTLFNNILITRNAPPIMEKEVVECVVAGAPDRSIGYITGDISRIVECDAWVNAENTKMEMGRLHDDSISAMIRFYGALRDPLNNIKRDIIREELLCQVGLHSSVEPGTVLTTSAGALQETNNVKLILHVAALHGEPAKGYLPIRDYPGCILRVLAEIQEINKGRKKACSLRQTRNWRGKPSVTRSQIDLEDKIQSVVIPLFGSRTTGQHPQDVADLLFRAACVYFEQCGKDTYLKKIYFLAYTEADRQYCDGAIGSLMRGRMRLHWRSDQPPAPSPTAPEAPPH